MSKKRETKGTRTEYLRKRQAEAREVGRCLWCPEPAAPGKSLCVACLDSQRGTYEMRRINGLCVRCGKPANGKCRCPACAKKASEDRAAKKAKKNSTAA